MGKGDGNNSRTSRAIKVKQKAAPSLSTVIPKPDEPLLKSAFRTLGRTQHGHIIFNPQITTDDKDTFLLENVSGHHTKFPRKNSLSIRPDKHGKAMSFFGQNKTAYGHSNDHFQTSSERRIAEQSSDYKPPKKCTNTIQYMNDTWNMTHKDNKNAWFSNNKETIIVAISAFVAAGITLCLYGGTTKRKSKGKTRANKTRANKTRAKR
jgi:hypothetical protein